MFRQIKKYRWFIAAVPLVVISFIVFASLWSGPLDTGEFRDSPNDRFTAYATNRSHLNWRGQREWYLEVTVVEKTSQRSVWRATYHHLKAANVPDYGRRGERFIMWAADSASVTVPVQDGRQLVLAIP
jgi:hypothetical protein